MITKNKNTYFHAVDEMLGVPNRLKKSTFTITIKDEEGKIYISPPFHTHYTKGITGGCSEFYLNYKKPLEELGAVTYSKLGKAVVYNCDAVKCTDIIRVLWEKTDHDLCMKEEEIPKAYYQDIRI